MITSPMSSLRCILPQTTELAKAVFSSAYRSSGYHNFLSSQVQSSSWGCTECEFSLPRKSQSYLEVPQISKGNRCSSSPASILTTAESEPLQVTTYEVKGDHVESGVGVVKHAEEEEQNRTESFPLKRINLKLPQSQTTSKVKMAEFVKSSANVSQCPQDGKPEFAVIGRSNVGKSSLINMLVNRKELAQTSKRPGKTQLINHFIINKNWYLVDLPGYGYAKVPQVSRAVWSEFTKEYFLKRENLITVLLLVDASLPPQQIDIECADWFGQNKVPIAIIFTKCDRRKKLKSGGKPPVENVKAFEAALAQHYDEIPPWIMTSSTNGMGKDDLLNLLAQLREFWAN